MNIRTALWVFPSAAIALCLALAPATPVRAEQTVQKMPAVPRDVIPDTTTIPANVKQKILDHMAQTNLERLRGWPGIIFYCPVDEATNANVKNICAALNTKAGALFSTANIKFQIAKNAFDVHFLPHMTGRMVLAVELDASPQDAQPSAIFAKLKALAHYAHAVNWSSELTPGQEAAGGKGPLDVPQHVDALLWERNQIAVSAGSQSALADTIGKGLEQQVQVFIADFTRVNQ